jgi:hypothetical protein
MNEKLEPIKLIKCLTETHEELQKRRNRTTTDLEEKGTPFEKWIMQQIKRKATVTIIARNQWLDIIPPKEYEKAKQYYSKTLASLHDIGIMWNGKLQIIIEAGYREKFYFDPYTLPQCECSEWKNNNHVSLPKFDVERYTKIHTENPEIPYWIIIGKQNEIFAIVKLEDWTQNTFTDYNESLIDNHEQSVICLKQTPHHTDIEQWMKAVHMPKK